MKKLLCIALLAAPIALSATDSVTTPEPASILLVGGGLLGIGFLARRRNRKK
jgi:PEP-CTERM motif